MAFIDLKEFEHFFESSILKKGLQLFKRNRVFFISKNTEGLYHFSVESKKISKISLVKKGRKISNYHCNCGSKKSVCEHICSVLFYIETPSLNLDLKNQKNLFFQKKYVSKSPYLKLRIEIKNSLNDYLQSEKLLLKNTNDIITSITKIENKIKNSNKDDLFFFHLAVVCELPKIFTFKLIPTKNYILNSIKFIEAYCSNPLKSDELEDLYETSLQIFKNKRYLKIDCLYDIIKKSISLINDKHKISSLKNYVFKLKKHSSSNLFSLDETQILKNYILIKEDFLDKNFYTKKIDLLNIEYAIATFEFKINCKKKSTALKELNSFYKILKQKNDKRIVYFLQYVLLVSKKYNHTKLEINCICDLLIYDFEINDELLNRSKEIVEKDKIEFVINNVISEIKSKKTSSTNLKVITLLNYFGRFDDIVLELENLGNQFQLLHFIALKNLPQFSIEFIDLYIIHLRSAIQNTNYDYRKEQIFKSAKKYITQLPLNAKNYLLDKILSYFNTSQPVYKLIRESYF